MGMELAAVVVVVPAAAYADVSDRKPIQNHGEPIRTGNSSLTPPQITLAGRVPAPTSWDSENGIHMGDLEWKQLMMLWSGQAEREEV